MTKNDGTLKHIIEAALLASGRPLSVDTLLRLFLDDEQPDRAEVKAALAELAEDYAERGIEVREVGSGWRIQVRSQYAPWISRLWEEKPPRYSRALMETLALIAYRQPITRGEIEEIRGVAVSTNIVKTLLEREWVRVVGHRDVPGKPALYATTRAFLDYFGLTGLDDLPTLAEIKDLDSLNQELHFSEEAGEMESEAGADDAGQSGTLLATEASDVMAAEDISEPPSDEAQEPEKQEADDSDQVAGEGAVDSPALTGDADDADAEGLPVGSGSDEERSDKDRERAPATMPDGED